MAKQNKSLRIRDVGTNLGLKELTKLTQSTGKDPLTIMSKALKKGITLGGKVVNAYNNPSFLPGGFGNYVYQATPDNLKPLKGLTMGKGQVYKGATSYTIPGNSGKAWNSPTPDKVSYNPIIGMKNESSQDSGGKGSKMPTTSNGSPPRRRKNDRAPLRPDRNAAPGFGAGEGTRADSYTPDDYSFWGM